MKRTTVILISVFAAVVIALGAIIAWTNHSMQTDVRFSDDSCHAACYPINSGMVTVADGVRMAFDTASPVSTITEADIEKLRSQGYEVKEISTLFFGHNPDDELTFSSVRYEVSLPAPAIDLSMDDSVCSAFAAVIHPEIRLEHLSFIPSTDGVSHLGIDILGKFAIEYSWITGMVTLRDSVPDDYQMFASMKSELSPSSILNPGRRRFIDLEVDNRSNSYLINTSVSRIKLNIPVDDGTLASAHINDPYLLNGHYVNADRELDQIVKIGNRAKYQDIHRSGAKDNSECYFCNPLNMFVSDVVMDLRDNKFYIRKGAKMVSHSPRFGLAAE